jgi:hypothetical protein
VIVVGCGLSAGQRTAVRQFASATAILGETASTQLIEMRHATVLMNARRLALADATASARKGFNLDLARDLDGAFDVDRVATRVKAAAALRTYGELLWSLAADTQVEELRSAADQFVASARGLAGSAVSGGDLEQMGRAVEAVGTLFAECRRARAIARIVSSYRHDVSRLAELLRQDFDPDAGRLATGFVATTSNLAVTASDVLHDSPGLGQRAAALDAVRLARTTRDRIGVAVFAAFDQQRQANDRVAQESFGCVRVPRRIDATTLDEVNALTDVVRGILDELDIVTD